MSLPIIKIKITFIDNTIKEFEGETIINERFIKVSSKIEKQGLLIEAIDSTNSIYFNWDSVKIVETFQ